MRKRLILFIFIINFFSCKKTVEETPQPTTPTTIKADAIVAKDGSGKFTSIQEAINSLTSNPPTRRVIYIKNGTYSEKISLENKNSFTLQGESQDGVIITISQSRDKWLCENSNSDWGVATINLRNASDLTLQNLTFLNTYGKDNPASQDINCSLDASGKRTVKTDAHQMVLRSAQGVARLRAINCTFRSYGGDTVSPWDTSAGMYYFENCTIEGGVDMYCPRGWAYAEKCKFICHNKSAAIWHDGSADKNSKTVLKNCEFDGDSGFKLGRFHLDSQFYLIDCSFSSNMADADIYYVSGTDLKWDKRVYYSNCKRTGGDFTWYKDNLPSGTMASSVTPSWTFDGKWDGKEK